MSYPYPYPYPTAEGLVGGNNYVDSLFLMSGKHFFDSVREAAKKVLFLVAGPIRGGGGLNGCATKGKKNVFNVRKTVPMATKPGG